MSQTVNLNIEFSLLNFLSVKVFLNLNFIFKNQSIFQTSLSYQYIFQLFNKTFLDNDFLIVMMNMKNIAASMRVINEV
jgi:hypothetical protein